ncbi:DUF551 domain-containing protein [Enterobacter roggenkampii]|uniref:DUF551 domain-containing protein n=1 Tax=Enterobacter roggenkampii TaxID=1812935 RepID=UPI0005EF2386|nr:DUF551 domain-containing protein [Enterobacter roggenkampii]KJM49107.1 hypothetical protein SS30_17025 [Enterobacter roggenkampii]
MSTITKEFTKEQLQQIIETDHVQCGEASSLARIALASLEAEPRGYIDAGTPDDGISILTENKLLKTDIALYTAPPAPVSVPAAMEMDDDFDSAFEHGKAVGWNAYRAAMLQGADRPQNEPQNIPENIPATQFKPVADLYGLTSPTGGETSFTFDAVEARDFIDGGWSCQEYVELGRFQEAVSGNSPVIPEGWVACSKRMPSPSTGVIVAAPWQSAPGGYAMKWATNCPGHPDADIDGWIIPGASWSPTHWQPLPAAPQQEA